MCGIQATIHGTRTDHAACAYADTRLRILGDLFMSRAAPDASNLLPGRFGRGVGLAPPCATADQKQGAQPSASPFAPALLTHFDFYSKRLCFAIEDAQSGESGLGRGEYKRRLPFTRRSS